MQRNKLMNALLALAAGCLTALSLQGAVFYVDGVAGDDARAGTGGWGDALKTLTNALAMASSGSEVWVKAGTYKPTLDNNREKSFVMKDGVDLYGGFDGTETSRDARDWVANPTHLSGELGSPDTLLDNSLHVVIGATARLDGFIISNGCASNTASSSNPKNCGAGMYTSGAYPITANCVFSNNLAVYGVGGGVYWNQGGYNTCTTGWYNCIFDGNMSSNSWSQTPGLYLQFWTNTVGAISNCTFRRNKGFTGGTGALCMTDSGKKIWPAGAAFTVQDCVFSNNLDWSAYSGGVNVLGFVAPVVFEDCLFIGNTNYSAVSSGGGGAMTIGLSATGQGVRMNRCIFDRNYSSKSGAVAMYTGGGTNSIWSHCVFRNNHANKYGGVFYGAVDGTFESCLFTNNSAPASTSGGGALYISSVGHTAVDRYTDCSFYDSVTGLNGGAVSLTAGAAEFRDCDFVNGKSGPWGVGGALIYWSGTGASAGLFDNCLFANGEIISSGGSGGAIYHAGGDLTMTNCRFVANTAKTAGAIYSAAGALPVASDCHFVSNTIGTAKTFGGAWYALGPVQIRRSVFDGNRAAAGRGGALCIRNVSMATGLVANCVFRDNIGLYGGAIATSNAHLRLSHVTACTNLSLSTAHGGALSHASDGTPLDGLVDNCIFWGNGASEILPAAGVVCRYSNVGGGFAGEGNRNVDPRFADTQHLHLSSKTGVYTGGYFDGGAWQVSPSHSPLIDAGDPAAAWSLEPVPNNGRVNMGAYGNTPVASMSLRGGTVLLVH